MSKFSLLNVSLYNKYHEIFETNLKKSFLYNKDVKFNIGSYNLDFIKQNEIVSVKYKNIGSKILCLFNLEVNEENSFYIFSLFDKKFINMQTKSPIVLSPSLISNVNFKDKDKSNFLFAKDKENEKTVLLLKTVNDFSKSFLIELKTKFKVLKYKDYALINLGPIDSPNVSSNIKKFISNYSLDYDEKLNIKIIGKRDVDSANDIIKDNSSASNNAFKPKNEILKDRQKNKVVPNNESKAKNEILEDRPKNKSVEKISQDKSAKTPDKKPTDILLNIMPPKDFYSDKELNPKSFPIKSKENHKYCMHCGELIDPDYPFFKNNDIKNPVRCITCYEKLILSYGINEIFSIDNNSYYYYRDIDENSYYRMYFLDKELFDDYLILFKLNGISNSYLSYGKGEKFNKELKKFNKFHKQIPNKFRLKRVPENIIRIKQLTVSDNGVLSNNLKKTFDEEQIPYKYGKEIRDELIRKYGYSDSNLMYFEVNDLINRSIRKIKYRLEK